jgi:hypothetical protein
VVDAALPPIVLGLKGNSIRPESEAFHHAVRPTPRNQVLAAVIGVLEIINRFKESSRTHSWKTHRSGWTKWLPAIWLIAANRNGISSWELHRALGVTQKTAWFILQRIRLAMQDEITGGKLGS